jgi:signal transduction histidine kinase/CheY-like chemotaxis protein
VFGGKLAWPLRRGEAEHLRAANETLEQRVQERTEALTRAITALDEARVRAEAANHAKSDFLASVSHELRTPLNAILGFAQILRLTRHRDPLTHRQAEALHQIERSGRLLLQLIEDVLDLAKIEAGQISLSLEPVDAAGLVEEVAQTFSAAAAEADVSITMMLPPEPVLAVADRTRLQQVLNNLLSNAIKYNKLGGRVELSVREDADGVEIAVADTGLGIPAAQLQNLFQPFHRLGREQSDIVGTGIGLALCRRLLDSIGGEIRVWSEENSGSRFCVMLQRAVAHPAVHRPAPPPVIAPKPGQRLLYIEDNPSNVLLMRHIVQSCGGLHLDVAVAPLEGLALARTEHPDVILLDINLPGMDGFEVLRRLRAEPKTASIPVIALSANAMQRDIDRGLAAGFTRYLTKPLDVGVFLDALGKVLAERTAA